MISEDIKGTGKATVHCATVHIDLKEKDLIANNPNEPVIIVGDAFETTANNFSFPKGSEEKTFAEVEKEFNGRTTDYALKIKAEMKRKEEEAKHQTAEK